MASENKDIQIEYDTVSNNYYIIWQPMVAIGAGSTRKEALDDLRKAAHFGVDTILSREMDKAG
jgi:hypothetical protein